MIHPKTGEVYDRKERSIGIIRKRETKSVSFVLYRSCETLQPYEHRIQTSLKEQYEHTKDNRFYKQIGDEYPLHVSLGHSSYC